MWSWICCGNSGKIVNEVGVTMFVARATKVMLKYSLRRPGDLKERGKGSCIGLAARVIKSEQGYFSRVVLDI